MKQAYLHEILKPKSPRIFPPWEQRQAGTWQPWDTYPHRPGSYVVSSTLKECVFMCTGRTAQTGAARYVNEHWDAAFERFCIVQVADEYGGRSGTFTVPEYTFVRELTQAEVLEALR